MTDLAVKLKGLRNTKGLSRTDVANLVPMERSYLWQIEQGKAENIGRKIMRGLAQALDVSIDYLDDNSIEETRSWAKVAVDESLEKLLKKTPMREVQQASLRRVSFTQSAPRTIKEWEQFWNNLKTYSQPRSRTQSSRSRLRLPKNINPE